MRRAPIPTAASQTFTALHPPLAYIKRHAEPLVVKASGLAAGKGAVVCARRTEAARTARAMLVDAAFGDAGREIVIEDFLKGEELRSWHSPTESSCSSSRRRRTTSGWARA